MSRLKSFKFEVEIQANDLAEAFTMLEKKIYETLMKTKVIDGIFTVIDTGYVEKQ